MQRTLKHPSTNSRLAQPRVPNASPAFSFVELLVVVAVILVLSALLIPTMAGAKADNWRAQCQSQMKQLGTAMGLFAADRNDRLPAAGCSGDSGTAALTWDSYLHRYAGGTASDAELLSGVLDADACPKALRCPTDVLPDIYWNPSGIFGRKTYNMVAVGPNWTTEWQVRLSASRYVLPNVRRGLGIYWQAPADWEAPGYRTSVVKDPGGTLMLVENPANDNVAGNIWPCITIAPVGNSPNPLFQVNPQATPPFAGSSTINNYGAYTYQVHGERFNYLFHDGHVEALKMEQTVGTGNTTNNPCGMWTVAAGD